MASKDRVETINASDLVQGVQLRFNYENKQEALPEYAENGEGMCVLRMQHPIDGADWSTSRYCMPVRHVMHM
jgi:hypothetical protein